jgi:hypothetical protein
MVGSFGSLPLIVHHALEEADQFFLRTEGKLDPPPRRFRTIRTRVWRRRESFSSASRVNGVAVLFSMDAIAGGHACCPFLGLAHREGSAHDFLGEKLLVVGRRQREQSLGVSGGELTAADPVSDLRR